MGKPTAASRIQAATVPHREDARIHWPAGRYLPRLSIRVDKVGSYRHAGESRHPVRARNCRLDPGIRRGDDFMHLQVGSLWLDIHILDAQHFDFAQPCQALKAHQIAFARLEQCPRQRGNPADPTARKIGFVNTDDLVGLLASLLVANRYRGAEKYLIGALLALPGTYVRLCREPHLSVLRRGTAVPKTLLISELGKALASKVRALGLPANDGFRGVYGFSGRVPFATLMSRFLDPPVDRALVMVHPGRVDDELRRLDPLVDQREVEFAFLAGEHFGVMLKEKGIRLGRFSECLGGATG